MMKTWVKPGDREDLIREAISDAHGDDHPDYFVNLTTGKNKDGTPVKSGSKLLPIDEWFSKLTK